MFARRQPTKREPSRRAKRRARAAIVRDEPRHCSGELRWPVVCGCCFTSFTCFSYFTSFTCFTCWLACLLGSRLLCLQSAETKREINHWDMSGPICISTINQPKGAHANQRDGRTTVSDSSSSLRSWTGGSQQARQRSSQRAGRRDGAPASLRASGRPASVSGTKGDWPAAPQAPGKQ